MALPVPQLPAEPAEPGSETSDEEQSCLDIPAALTIARLQPAKMAVWRLFMEQARPGLKPSLCIRVSLGLSPTCVALLHPCRFAEWTCRLASCFNVVSHHRLEHWALFVIPM